MNWSNVDFKDITLSDAYDASGITGKSGDAGGNTGITFTTPQTQYWKGNSGVWQTAANWGTTSGGSGGRVPLPQDDVVFDNNSFNGAGQTVTVDMPRMGKNIDWSAYNEGQSPTWAKTLAAENYGSITLNSGMINTGTTAFTMAGRGSHTFTSAGQTWTNPLTIAAVGGTVTLQDDFVSSATTTLTHGTFNANTSNVTAPAFSITGTATRVLQMGTGTWTANTPNGNAWDATATTSLTITPGSSTIVISNTGSASKTFVGGWMTYNNATFSGDNITVTGSNAFNALAVNTAGLTNGLKFTSGTTQTVSSFSTNGSAGNLAKLVATPSGIATISKSSGTVSVDYMSIASSTATGGATWYAGTNSTNVGNNTGWLFSAPSSAPTVTTNTPTSVATSTMVLNGTIAVDGSASSTVRGFAWGTNAGLSGGDTATTTENGTFGVGSFFASLSSLTPNTLYYFRAYATGTGGTGYGAISSTTTLPWTVPSSPTSVSAVGGNQSVTLTFTPGATGGSPILYYYASSTPGNIASTSSGSPITVTGLTNGTSYTFQVYAVSALGTSSPSTASSAVTPSNIVLDMDFDNDSPPTAVDDSIFVNNGTISGAAATTTCANNSCYSFDGVNDYISVANSASLSPTSAITISAWVRPIGKGGGANYLSVVRKTGSYSLDIRQDGTTLFYLTGVNNWIGSTGASFNLFDGAWHNLVATYNGSLQSLYVDGVLVATTSASGNITTTSNEVDIGGVAGVYYKGIMDNVRLYNNSLTSTQIQALYESYYSTHSPRTYYISSSSGNDNNNGLSAASPWRNIDMIYKEAQRPGGIRQGDTILLKRGDVWGQQISFIYFGTTTLNATTTIDTYGDSSDPKPLIYGDGRYLTWTAVGGGVYEADLGAGASIYGVYEGNTALTSTIDGSSMAAGTWARWWGTNGNMIRIHTSDDNPPTNIRVFHYFTIEIDHAYNLKIKNLDIRETFRAVNGTHSRFIDLNGVDTLDTLDSSILFNHTSDSFMRNGVNNVSGCTTLYFAYDSSRNIMSNNVISGATSTISGILTPEPCDHCAIGLNSGTGNLIEHNNIGSTTATFNSAIDFWYERDITIRYNFFMGDGGTWPHAEDLLMYGNVGGKLGSADNIGSTPLKIFNNTFKGYVNAGGDFGTFDITTAPIEFKNNIVYQTSANSVVADFYTNVDADNNCYYSTVAGSNRFKYDGTLYSGIAAYQTASGLDANSVYGDPLFASTAPGSHPSDFALQSGSPCKDIGTDLSGEFSPYEDYAGVSLPQGSAPDAGGLEYVAVGAPTTPTVTTGTASSITTSAATLSGSIDSNGGGDATEHGFAFGTDPDLGSAATTTEGAFSGTGDFTASIPSLTCATNYYARAYATNSAGTGFGSIISFTTSACPVSRVSSSARSGGSGILFRIFRGNDGQKDEFVGSDPGFVRHSHSEPVASYGTTEEGESMNSPLPLLSRILRKFSWRRLTNAEKEVLPRDVVFAAPSDFPEYDVSSQIVSSESTTQPNIRIIQGKPIDLAIKSEKPVKEITGYLTIKKLSRKEALLALQDEQKQSQLAAVGAGSENKLLLESFKYSDPDKDGIYTASIVAPKVTGEFDILTVIEYEDEGLGFKELHMTLLIDPEGYVYEERDGAESRISGAVVSIWNAKDGTLWDATSFLQQNPQTTDRTGQYSFLVPEGSYYITAEADQFAAYRSETFEVNAYNGIHFDIKMERKNAMMRSLLDWRVGLITVLVIGIGVHLLWDRRFR